MLSEIKDLPPVKRVRKSMLFSRLRQSLPMDAAGAVDDRGRIEDAEPVVIDWPSDVPKPRVGVVKDQGPFPRWTKYLRCLETNGFPHALYDIHAHDWIRKAAGFDVIAGIVSNEADRLEEVRVKYRVLEDHMGKACYPSADQALLYENKWLEAFVAQACGLPLAPAHISHSREDALALIEGLRYPAVSKVNQSSGSLGVELVRRPREARRIVERAFSRNGRPVHVPWVRQRSYVYFQDFVPNDGYDIRVVLIGNLAFGYYRKVPRGDFRASGMGKVEKRGLPEEAIRVAREVQRCVPGPQVVVDMVHGLDGRYVIVEFSLFYQVETPEQLLVDGVPGAYVVEDDGRIHFEKGRYWVHELALRRYLLDEYLPRARRASPSAAAAKAGGGA